MVKIGVLGAGHLGKIHLRNLQEIQTFDLIGFYDPDPEKSSFATEEFGIPSFPTIESLLEVVDAIDIVTPTLSHYDCAVLALNMGKHIFVEKPLTNTVDEARILLKMVENSGLKAQVGHVERFNPAFLAASENDLSPMFVEAHRLAEFKPRGTDVSVVLDLMIHDIDILLSMVKSEVENVSASGVPVISDRVDIANARVEFENGCVANLTASRVSLKTERKMRIFQKNSYITLDFLKKEAHIFNLRELGENEESDSMFVIDPGEGKTRKEINYHQPKTGEVNAIKMELSLFADSIINDTKTAVTIQDGYRSLLLANQILDKIALQFEKSKKFENR